MNELDLLKQKLDRYEESRRMVRRLEQVQNEKSLIARLKKIGGHVDLIKIRF